MKKFLLMIACLVIPLLAQAQVVQQKGVGTSSYTNELTPEIKERSYVAAQMAAIERYFAEGGESESENFEANKEKIEANLDKFLLSTSVLNEQDQTSLKKYSVAVRVEINVAKLRNTIRGSSAVSKAGSIEKSQLAYVFVGREIASVRSFDDRVVKRVESSEKIKSNNSKSTSGSEGESISDTSISTSTSKQSKQNASQDASIKIETGGSTTRKADDTSYRLLPMSMVKTSITSVFSQGGFNVADPEFVLSDKEFKAVQHDYANGNDLQPGTLRSVVNSMRKAKVPILVLATLDVGAASDDPATGMRRVPVTVTGRVLDLSNALPREIASVPPVQQFGLGSDNKVASDKGLKDAALAAAREVVSRLNAAGIR
jgi:hypothetical protein